MKMLLTAAIATFAFAQPALADVRGIDVPGLKGIEASGRYDVVIVGGAAPSATLEGPATDLARLETTFSGGVLKVSEKCRFRCGRDLNVVLRVVAPSLASLDISRGIEADARNISAGALALTVEMGAELDIAGRCESLSARARMGADLDASGLVCRQVDIAASMGADVEVYASEQVRANGSMGADITVLGNPARRESSGSMGASISSP